MRKIQTHLEYISSFPPPVRKKLQELRTLIRKVAPQTSEKISYGVAAFWLEGPLVYIGGFKNHVSFFPTSSAISAFKDQLQGFRTSRGAMQLPLDQPLPRGLITKMVRFRLREQRGKKKSVSKCDARASERFDYSRLSPELTSLAKPAQRALIREGLYSPSRIAQKSQSQLLELHGLGLASLPVLRRILRSQGLKLKA